MKNKVKDFIEAIITLSKEHGLSISQRDNYGTFKIEAYDEDCSNWLRDADIDINEVTLRKHQKCCIQCGSTDLDTRELSSGLLCTACETEFREEYIAYVNGR